jgi:hypothetical protein
MGNHYYHPTTGELIDGDLRQARKVNALPSPTTVLNILGSPGLKYYFRKQMWEATATTTRMPNESDDDFFDRCCRWADEHGQAARDKGGDFHTLCQKFHEDCLKGDGENRRASYEQYRLTTAGPLAPQFQAYADWYCANVKRSLMVEQTVIGQGYAGRVDHVAELMDGRVAVCDVKTQDISKKKNRFTYYANWAYQLSAYWGAVKPLPDVLVSVAVSSSANQPVVVEAYYWPKPPSYYLDIFLGLLKAWNEENNYHPT